MLKRIIRSLKGTKDYRITYQKSYQCPQPLIGYADAAHANTNEKKSTTGLIYIAAGSAILWKSKKQMLTTLFLMKAEYVAMAHAGMEAR